MKAIILSAGQGKRLLPLTEETPKCMLPVAPGMTTLGWQIAQLADAGIREVVVVTGFHAEKVEAELERHRGLTKARSHYNPLYAVADNLTSVWSVREEMDRDFLLINGDTLFTAEVVQSLLDAPRHPITVTVSRKAAYDADDMKVIRDGIFLHSIGKTIDVERVDAESIGMILFSGSGVETFRGAVERAAEDEASHRKWYLSVIDGLAKETLIATAEVPAPHWCEVDFPVDLQRAREAVKRWSADESAALPAAEAS